MMKNTPNASGDSTWAEFVRSRGNRRASLRITATIGAGSQASQPDGRPRSAARSGRCHHSQPRRTVRCRLADCIRIQPSW